MTALLVVLVHAAWAEPVGAVSRVTDVAVQVVDDAVVVSIETAGNPEYRREFLEGPFRLVLDFADTSYGWKARMPVNEGPVKEIRGSQFRVGVARLVIELTRKAAYRIEPLAGGIRVVFAPPERTTSAAKTPASGAKPRSPSSGPWRLQGIVMIDGVSAAYIAEGAMDQPTRYVVGDRIGEGLVESIEERRVVLKMPRGAVELRLDDESAPAPWPRP